MASNRALAGEVRQLEIQVFATEGCDGKAGTVDDGPCVRDTVLFVPTTRPGPMPLHIALHGGGGDGEGLMKARAAFEGRYNELAERDGFVVAYPNGVQRRGGGRSWNDCRGDVDAASSTFSGADDVAFIAALIERIGRDSAIDSKRVYVSGISNGGLMTFRLYQELGERFAAFASFAANMPATNECREPTAARALMIVFGDQDRLMPPQGGCVAADCGRGRVLSIADTAAYWIKHLRPQPATERNLPDVVRSDRSTITEIRYPGGRNGSELILLRQNGAGHTMPGADDPIEAYASIVGQENHDVHSADLLVEFFGRFAP
jgi:polyhydroxybutyrate depolymerase